MKESFDKAFIMLEKFEGYYSNDPNDSGGETFFGISSENWPNQFAEIMALKTLVEKREYAKNFYKKNFWDVIGCDNLPYPLDICAFDLGVNSGVNKAKNLLKVTTNWKDYLFNRIEFYLAISQGKNKVFLRNWITRVFKIWKLCNPENLNYG